MDEAVELLRKWAGEEFAAGHDTNAQALRDAANRLRGHQTDKLTQQRDAEHRKEHPPSHNCLSCQQGRDYK